MKRGTRTQPKSLRLLTGSHLERINVNEPKPDKTNPVCPAWLPADAKTVWRRVVPELKRMGVLTHIDRDAMVNYCIVYAKWQRAEKELLDGFTYEAMDAKTFKVKQHVKPEVAIARDSLNQIRQYQCEFGMTPSSRTGINAKTHKEKTGDVLEELLTDNREN